MGNICPNIYEIIPDTDLEGNISIQNQPEIQRKKLKNNDWDKIRKITLTAYERENVPRAGPQDLKSRVKCMAKRIYTTYKLNIDPCPPAVAMIKRGLNIIGIKCYFICTISLFDIYHNPSKRPDIYETNPAGIVEYDIFICEHGGYIKNNDERGFTNWIIYGYSKQNDNVVSF
jgi:hypothetical protein